MKSSILVYIDEGINVDGIGAGSTSRGGPTESVDNGLQSKKNAEEPSNGDIMARLDTMMQNMAMKHDPTQLKTDITKETKVTVSQVVDPIKNELADVRQDVKALQATTMRKDDAQSMIKDAVAGAVDMKIWT